MAHAYDFKDITDITYVPDGLDIDACTVFELQQKHAFGLLVSNVKESSVLPIIRKSILTPTLPTTVTPSYYMMIWYLISQRA